MLEELGMRRTKVKAKKILPDVIMLDFTIVNAYIVGQANDWVLVDTGLVNTFDDILETLQTYFKEYSRPNAVILTHGHYDHVGCLKDIIDRWNLSIYAHELETPYLVSERNYQIALPAMYQDFFVRIVPDFSDEPLEIESNLKKLPEDGTVPGMKDFRWIYTPGHTQGHISLFREKDGVLIPGDLTTTVSKADLDQVKNENENAEGSQLNFIEDQEAWEDSVRKISLLNPKIMLPSHGQPIANKELEDHLAMLMESFKTKDSEVGK